MTHLPETFRLIPRAGALPVAEEVLADGAVWPDGAVSLRWRGPVRFTAAFPTVEAVKTAYGMIGEIAFEPVLAAEIFRLMPRPGALPYSRAVLAAGVIWPDATLSLRWSGAFPFTAEFPSLQAVESAYGMGGQLVFVFGPDPAVDADR